MKKLINMKFLSASILFTAITASVFAQEQKTITVNVDGDKVIVNGVPTRKGQLGVRVEDATQDAKGALVIEVLENSPAALLGLQEGDVIISINDKSVSEAKEVVDLIGQKNAGDEVSITWLRDGKKKQGKTKLAKAPVEFQTENDNVERRVIINGQPLAGGKQNNTVKKIIINGQPLTKEQIEEFEVEGFPMEKIQGGNPLIQNELKVLKGLNGSKEFTFEVNAPAPKIGFTVEDLEDHDAVKITDVKEGSQAAKAGLKVGDVITIVDGKSINGTDELLKAVKQGKEKSTLNLGVERNGKFQTITVKLPKKIKKVEL